MKSAEDGRRGRRPRARQRLGPGLAISAVGVAAGGVVSRYLVGARLTDLRRIAHLLPHDALSPLIITAGIVVVILGWRVIVYLERRDQRRHETIARMQDQKGVYQRYEDSSSTYVRYPVAPVGRSEQSQRRTRRSRPPQLERPVTGMSCLLTVTSRSSPVPGRKAAFPTLNRAFHLVTNIRPEPLSRRADTPHLPHVLAGEQLLDVGGLHPRRRLI
jgi:hypothetical protein